ncbi:MAG TPA: hypothetical protein VGF08_03390 [Terriglobales bacterium]|jgi:hypothetical protein
MPSLATRNSPSDSALAAACDRKIQHVEKNGGLEHPDPTPTEFSEQEINAYVASGRVTLPAGVTSVRFEGRPGVVTATLRVDFDKIRAGRESSNPLLSLFTGVHDIVVLATGRGTGRQGQVHVQSVSLDGTEIPRVLLEIFIRKYLQPKYPEVGMDSQFPLPYKIETATIGEHKLTVTQK